jgi:hypothetical protein
MENNSGPWKTKIWQRHYGSVKMCKFSRRTMGNKWATTSANECLIRQKGREAKKIVV